MSEDAAEYRPAGRPGLTASAVAQLCDQMLKRGERPTIEKVRHVLGGSPNTITRLLDKWWEALGVRLERGSVAFERIPSELALHAEAFFLNALEAARKIAVTEQQERRDGVIKLEEQLSLQGHVLTLREKELQAMLAQRERMTDLLEQQLTDRRTLLEKTLATKDSLTRDVGELRITVATLQAKLAATLAAPRPKLPRPRRPVRASKAKARRAPPKRVRAKRVKKGHGRR